MKKLDISIINQLRRDGRMPLTELSRKTELPVSTIHDQLKKNIRARLIKPTVLIDFEKIGFLTRAHIFLAVEQTEKDKLFAYLKEHPNTNSIFRINNGWNVMMECIFKDMKSMENFVEQLEVMFHIKQKEIHYTLEELKREGFLANAAHAGKLLG